MKAFLRWLLNVPQPPIGVRATVLRLGRNDQLVLTTERCLSQEEIQRFCEAFLAASGIRPLVLTGGPWELAVIRGKGILRNPEKAAA